MAKTAERGGIGFDEVGGPIPAGCSGGRMAGQLERDGLAGQRVAVRINQLNRVAYAVLGVGEQRSGLLCLIAGREPGKAGVGNLLHLPQRVDDADGRAAPVADGGLLQHIAVVIDFESQRVLDAWIGRVALVVEADGFIRVGQEDGVTVAASGLQGADAEVLLGDGVGRAGALYLLWGGAGLRVIGIDLLAQHGAFEGAAGFALLLQSQAGGKKRVRQ